MKCRPPALVEMFPPMWQLPFAPKSSGIINLNKKDKDILDALLMLKWEIVAHATDEFG
jgi:hypothetical protein